MEREVLLIGTMIALLRRQFPAIAIKMQIADGIRVAREIGVDEAIAREAGGEPTSEIPIVEVAQVTTTTSYQTVVEYTITSGRTAVIAKMEMACRANSDYDLVQWRITVNDTIVYQDALLPASLTLDLALMNVRGGKLFKIEAKNTSGSSIAWADITGKEIIWGVGIGSGVGFAKKGIGSGGFAPSGYQNATLNGTLDDDGGEACDCGFEYGLTISYGTTTATQSKTTGQTFSQAITGLIGGQTYHFRSLATNTAGTGQGLDRTFDTWEERVDKRGK